MAARIRRSARVAPDGGSGATRGDRASDQNPLPSANTITITTTAPNAAPATAPDVALGTVSTPPIVVPPISLTGPISPTTIPLVSAPPSATTDLSTATVNLGDLTGTLSPSSNAPGGTNTTNGVTVRLGTIPDLTGVIAGGGFTPANTIPSSPPPLIPPQVPDQAEGFSQAPTMPNSTAGDIPTVNLGPEIFAPPDFQMPDFLEMAQNGPRYSPGTATSSSLLPTITGQWLQGTDGNAGMIPAQIAASLEGSQFNSFDDFRAEFWKAVADAPDLAGQFSSPNGARMKQGYAPIAPESQQLNGQRYYVLHHCTPISQGGSVYDMSNLSVVTPKMHQSILDPSFHFGGGSQ